MLPSEHNLDHVAVPHETSETAHRKQLIYQKSTALTTHKEKKICKNYEKATLNTKDHRRLYERKLNKRTTENYEREPTKNMRENRQKLRQRTDKKYETKKPTKDTKENL